MKKDAPKHFAPDTWVARKGSNRPDLAKIKRVYFCSYGQEWIMDAVLYNEDGKKIGRKSPACGGPTNYEPALLCDDWMPIKKPEFPLEKDDSFYENWIDSLEFIGGVVSESGVGITDSGQPTI
jgi:hypothetical protein